MYKHVNKCVNIYIHTGIYISTYMYVSRQMHIHIHMYIYINTQNYGNSIPALHTIASKITRNNARSSLID